MSDGSPPDDSRRTFVAHVLAHLLAHVRGYRRGDGQRQNHAGREADCGAAPGPGGSAAVRCVLPRPQPPHPDRTRAHQLRRAGRAGARAAGERPGRAQGRAGGGIAAVRLRHPHAPAGRPAGWSRGGSWWSRASCCSRCPRCASDSTCGYSSTRQTTCGCCAGSSATCWNAGATIESIEAQYLGSVREMHERYVAPTRRHAHLIVPDGGDNRQALDVIAGKLLHLLAAA